MILAYRPVENHGESVENLEDLCGNAGESVGKTEVKNKNCKQIEGTSGGKDQDEMEMKADLRTGLLTPKSRGS
ncbi:MAG TPA: hypothetical protein V6D11_02430 [Waterburya sp.]|jgi:hypothetical protein